MLDDGNYVVTYTFEGLAKQPQNSKSKEKDKR